MLEEENWFMQDGRLKLESGEALDNLKRDRRKEKEGVGPFVYRAVIYKRKQKQKNKSCK